MWLINENQTNKTFEYTPSNFPDWNPGDPFTINIVEDSVVIDDCIITGGDQVSEAIKISGKKYVTIQNCKIYGGLEDCFDMVKGLNITLRKNAFYCNSQTVQCITIKGSVKNAMITQNAFFGVPKKCYINLGDHTIYDVVKRPPVRNVAISYNAFQDGHIYYAWHAEKPHLFQNYGGKNRWWTPSMVPKSIVKTYFSMRNKGIIGDKPVVKPEDLIIQEWEK